jgi:hypothetical protein
VRYYLTWVKISNIKNKARSTGEGMEKSDSMNTFGGNANWCIHPGKQYGVPSENLK